ncbi:hypothetical protein K466DRAFT_174081 [Polyporus arcularius HHB13444]|uniref:Uncharacterized protein n=1 Tax=Polyporus arcularius HHB13444 TaxID=1314778 RepID=A0A5C3P8N1_9APHY|nr:hypothetical protein K466DRAFT_174081 [Polyporus arcularius HHB13444]
MMSRRPFSQRIHASRAPRGGPSRYGRSSRRVLRRYPCAERGAGALSTTALYLPPRTMVTALSRYISRSRTTTVSPFALSYDSHPSVSSTCKANFRYESQATSCRRSLYASRS